MLGPLGIGVPPLSSPIPQLPVDSIPNQIFNSQDLSSLENSGSVVHTFPESLVLVLILMSQCVGDWVCVTLSLRMPWACSA